MTIVIVGPSLNTRVTATHAPTTAARIGMNQTSESRVRFLGTFLDSGTDDRGGSRSGICNLFRICLLRTYRIPDQSRIERLDREHRKDHDRREEDQARSRFHRHEWLKLNQSSGEGIDEYVDHRPASYELDHPIHTNPLLVVRDGAALGR